ncbi:MAG: DNA-3-methyladenine glycosylase I [Treponema sp.]|jgi:DNA-3-methyladenine glycosylase I|nr:DNA-3-methyladenine glycosylase I [Treponema sp.]
MLDINNTEAVKEVFHLIKETLYTNFNKTNKSDFFNNWINWALNIKFVKEDDNEYFNKIKYIVFYSGFKAEIVTQKRDLIDHHLPNYSLVMNYTEDDVEKIINDENMIKNRNKIKAIIKNAKEINKIVKEHGSVFDYLNSFSPNCSWDNLLELRNELKNNFKYLGEITVYHFLTDIGINVLKPDRVITRIFYRLGLISCTKNLLEAIEVGRKIAEIIEKPIRFIDIIFVLYGQETNEGMCFEKNPKCVKCKIKKYCDYT